MRRALCSLAYRFHFGHCRSSSWSRMGRSKCALVSYAVTRFIAHLIVFPVCLGQLFQWPSFFAIDILLPRNDIGADSNLRWGNQNWRVRFLALGV